MNQPPQSLERAEYVEQAYLYQMLRERTAAEMHMQELLEQVTRRGVSLAMQIEAQTSGRMMEIWIHLAQL